MKIYLATLLVILICLIKVKSSCTFEVTENETQPLNTSVHYSEYELTNTYDISDNDNIQPTQIDYWYHLLLRNINIFTFDKYVIGPLIVIFFLPICITYVYYKYYKETSKNRNYNRKLTVMTVFTISTSLMVVACLLFQNINMLQEEFSFSLNKSIHNNNVYLNNTKREFLVELEDNYYKFSIVILDYNETDILDEIIKVTKAEKINDLEHLIHRKLPNIIKPYDNLEIITKELQVDTFQWNDNIKLFRQQYNSLCESSICNQNDTILENININQIIIPEISSTLKYVQNKLDLTKSKQKLSNILSTHLESIHKSLIEIKIKIMDAEHSNRLYFTSTINRLLNAVPTSYPGVISSWIEFLTTKYTEMDNTYIEYTLMLTTVLIVFGVTCYLFHYRPKYQKVNKDKIASNIFFSTALLLSIVAPLLGGQILVAVRSSITTQQQLCDPIRNPELTPVENMNKGLTFPGLGLTTNQSEFLKKCNENLSAYKVFNMQKLSNIESLIQQYNINEQLDEMNVSSISFDNFTILKNTELEDLQKLIVVLSEIDLKNIIFSLETMIDNIENANRNLKKFQMSVLNSPENYNTNQLSIIHNLIKQMQLYYENILKPMKKLAIEGILLAYGLDTDVNPTFGNLSNEILHLSQEVQHSQEIVQTRGSAILDQVIDDFKEKLRNTVKDYIYLLQNNIEEEIGKCEPLSSSINSVVVTMCDRIAVNKTPFVLFFCYIMYIILAVLCVRLSYLPSENSRYGTYNRFNQPPPYSSKGRDEYYVLPVKYSLASIVIKEPQSNT